MGKVKGEDKEKLREQIGNFPKFEKQVLFSLLSTSVNYTCENEYPVFTFHLYAGEESGLISNAK